MSFVSRKTAKWKKDARDKGIVCTLIAGCPFKLQLRTSAQPLFSPVSPLGASPKLSHGQEQGLENFPSFPKSYVQSLCFCRRELFCHCSILGCSRTLRPCQKITKNIHLILQCRTPSTGEAKLPWPSLYWGMEREEAHIFPVEFYNTFENSFIGIK